MKPRKWHVGLYTSGWSFSWLPSADGTWGGAFYVSWFGVAVMVCWKRGAQLASRYLDAQPVKRRPLSTREAMFFAFALAFSVTLLVNAVLTFVQ